MFQDADVCVAELEKYKGTPNFDRPVYIDAGGSSQHFPNVAGAIKSLADAKVHASEKEVWMRINGSYNTEAPGPWGNNMDGVYKSGVSFTNGDGTVPLLSLGYMCGHGWREFSSLNPAGIRVWTKEFEHRPVPIFVDPRGGPATAKHVEIIGNSEAINDILHIVGGSSSHLEKDHFFSNITKIGPAVTERLRSIFG